MRHNRSRRRLKRAFSHRKQLLENLALSLFRHQAIETTWPKAKEAQKLADRLITLGKDGTLHARRRAYAILGNREATTNLFNRIAPRFKDRKGGYTRVLHSGTRKGDGAPLALLELVEKEIVEKKPKAGKKKAAETHEPKKHEAGPEARHEHKHKHEERPAKKETQQKGGFLKNIQQFFRRKGGAA